MVPLEMMVDNLLSMWWIASAAVFAPILAIASRRTVPDVVWLLVLGVAIGPHGMGLAHQTESVEFLRELGMGVLFLLAGFEVDTAQMRSRTGRRAALTWLVSALLATGAGLLLFDGQNSAAIVFGLASTSTALGTLLPIIKDNDLGGRPLGRAVMVHGAWGELLPIVAMSLLLSARATWESAVVLLLFVALALVVVTLPARFFRRIPLLGRAFGAASNSTMQTTMRISLWTLVSLMLLSALLDLDVALGAFAAGLLLSRGFRVIAPEHGREIMHKLEVLGFSLLIPVFFVTSGMGIDVGAVAAQWPLLLAFVGGVALFRGLPIALAEQWQDTGSGLVTSGEQRALALFSATGLPIIVAVTQLPLASDLIQADTASVMVTGGALTVLLFPYLATRALARPTD